MDTTQNDRIGKAIAQLLWIHLYSYVRRGGAYTKTDIAELVRIFRVFLLNDIPTEPIANALDLPRNLYEEIMQKCLGGKKS